MPVVLTSMTSLHAQLAVPHRPLSVEEHQGDGDSVTKLHMDMADALNVLCHVQRVPEDEPPHVRGGDAPPAKPGYGGAGAVWDVWRREDVPKLRAFLMRHMHEFTHAGRRLTPSNVHDVIFDQTFMLTDRHRAMLLAEYGVQAWHFEQHEHEAVYIPAGCPHQVRNLRPCIKVAVDFVAPESMGHCLRMIEDLRRVAKDAMLADLGRMPLSSIAAPYERCDDLCRACMCHCWMAQGQR